MKVLVTGGTGYLGRAIVRSLIDRGHEPIVLARRAGQDVPCPAIEGDVRDHRAMRDAVRGVDGVIHSAALVSVWQRDPADFDRINVGGLETLLDVCALAQTGRIVVTSSFLALPPAGAARPVEANGYQRSKVRALESGEPGEEYIAGGENVPQMRAFELLRAARGTPLPRRIPGPLAHLVATWEEKIAARTRPPRVTRGTVRILLRDWPLDNARSIQKLSYRITPFDQGINRLLAGT